MAGDASAAETPSACPVLLFGQRREDLERRRKAYALGRRLGQGTFGTCCLGTRLGDGRQVAVKALNEASGQLKYAVVEAHVLDRCRDHPHIPRLFDIFVLGNQYHLVMEYGGVDLDTFLKASADQASASSVDQVSAETVSPGAVRSITKHVASALGFLHGAGMVHADVKPANIFVSTNPGGQVTAMLGDLGCVVEADPRARGQGAVTIQTLWWRAPEVLFGSRHADQAVDIWSLGLVLAELGGSRFQDGLQEKVACEVGYAFALFRQLGTPDTPELTELPLWMREAPKFGRRPWPRNVVLRLGAPGLDLLDALLVWAPTLRAKAIRTYERTDASTYVRPHARTYVRTYVRTYARPPPVGRSVDFARAPQVC